MQHTVTRLLPTLLPTLLSLLLTTSTLHAHPSIDLRLEHINARLTAQPDDAELLTDRGNAYLEHDEKQLALDDLTRATAREPTLGSAWYYRARTELAMGKFDDALTSNSRLIALYSGQSNSQALIGGLFQQGEIYVASGQPKRAAESYQQAISAEHNTSPEHYLQFIDALQQSQQYDAAIKAVQAAIQAHGNLPQILEKAADIELAHHRPAAALHWLDTLLEQPQRHEYLLLRKARIQRGMNDEAAAQASLEAALKAIQSLPKTQRYNEATLTLEQEIQREKTTAPSTAITAETIVPADSSPQATPHAVNK